MDEYLNSLLIALIKFKWWELSTANGSESIQTILMNNLGIANSTYNTNKRHRVNILLISQVKKKYEKKLKSKATK